MWIYELYLSVTFALMYIYVHVYPIYTNLILQYIQFDFQISVHQTFFTDPS